MAHLFRRQETSPGSHRDENNKEGSSLSALVATLVPTLIIAVIFIAIFLIFRNKFRRVYAPRTYIDSLGKERQTPAPRSSFLGWIKDFRSINDKYILDHQSIDGYLFVRYFKLIIVISFLGCCITWPVLFPVNATGGNGESQLDMLAMGNVKEPYRYFAHAGVSWIFLGLVMLIIARESFFTVNLRQAYRRSPWGASRLSQKTILFTSVPKTLTQDALFSMFPGVVHAWVVSDTKALQKLVEDRTDTAMKLETAEIQLSRDANVNRMKIAKGKKAYQATDTEDGTRYLDPKKRPTHKLKFLIGKKVDTIEYGRQHLAELNPKIAEEQEKHWKGDAPLVGSVFLEFNSQKAAQDAWQIMQDRKKRPNKSLKARQLGVLPQEVVWGNLRIGFAEHWVRWLLATAFITVMIVFWAVPVAFVGLVSKIDYLTSRFSWLEWINDIPKVILGVITGLLPVVMLAILMALVPIICRLMAKLAGYPTLSQIELQTQSWYFAFQVIQVFLITTCASAATAVVDVIIKEPGNAPQFLAENLPKASNFYISYFILFGLSASAGTLLNIGGFVTVVLLGRILPGKTPRRIFQKLIGLSAPAWGSEFPKWVNLGVIALSYSCIAPLVLGFSTIGLSLIYIAFRYQFLYCYETHIDTQGAAYQRTLNQLTVGVYLAELCLIGLFAISVSKSKHAIGPLVLEVILLALTILFHVTFRRALASHEARIAYSEDASPASIATAENGLGSTEKNGATDGTTTTHAPKPSKLPGFLSRLINPEKSSTANLSATLDAFYHTPQPALPSDVAKRAFLNPAITDSPPTLWIVRDEMGISERECRDSEKAVPGLRMTDEGAVFNEKGKVNWLGAEKGEARTAPVWEEEYIY